MADSSGDRRPPEFSVSLSSLFAFPYRFCHPPHPTVAKVRSCSVVPSFNVALDDVLHRRHLPPLGLKDFEEWLLFVEKAPQYLYFVLWLRDYAHRYNQWTKSSDEKSPVGTRPVSRSLAIFYTRAKQTFFSPDSPYHMCHLPESTLRQFLHPTMDSPMDSPHPHPSAFFQLESDVRAILSRSLESFVHAAFANVSTYRAVCGIVGGTMIALLTGLLPLLLTILLSPWRWIRCVGFPGLTIGSAIVIASCNGVCVGIYLFGDARQLRNFELVRPRIEKTPVLAIAPVSPLSPVSPSPLPTPTPASLIRKQWLEQTQQNLNSSKFSIHSALSIHSDFTPTTGASQAPSTVEIYISPAIDPVTGEYSPSPSLRQDESHELQEFPRTASFILPESYGIDGHGESQDAGHPENEETFDFQGLPPLRLDALQRKDSHDTHDSTKIPAPPDASAEKGNVLHARCSCSNTNVDVERGEEGSHLPREPNHSEPHYGSVPPFGPLTHILSPVVARAQWEVLFRSLVIGTVLSLAVVGALVGIPEMKFMDITDSVGVQ